MTNQFTWTSTFKSRSAKLTLVSVFAALLLFGCGGIDAPRIITFGDSTLDEGVEGYKPTIQGSSPTGPSSSRLFSNVVATALGSNELCAFFAVLTSGPLTQRFQVAQVLRLKAEG